MTDTQLAQLERMIREAYLQDEMEEEFFYKNLIVTAYEWALRDNQEQAKRLVGAVTEEYISEVLPVQMLENEEFGDMVYDLSRYLENRIEVEESDVQVEKLLLEKPRSGTAN